jgi:hypothetical protein
VSRKCFIARFELTVCHIEISSAVRDSSHRRGRLWMRDRALIRPVLAADGSRAEVYGESDEAILAAAVQWLETRFGTLSDPPSECRDPELHIKDEAAPVRWD